MHVVVAGNDVFTGGVDHLSRAGRAHLRRGRDCHDLTLVDHDSHVRRQLAGVRVDDGDVVQHRACRHVLCTGREQRQGCERRQSWQETDLSPPFGLMLMLHLHEALGVQVSCVPMVKP